MTKEDKRIWIKVLLALAVLLPGLPILMIIVVSPLAVLGLSTPLFMTAIMFGDLYYSLPAFLFGQGFFPSGEFGYMPTPRGFCFAFILYAFIALILSFPVSRMVRAARDRRRRIDGEQCSGG